MESGADINVKDDLENATALNFIEEIDGCGGNNEQPIIEYLKNVPIMRENMMIALLLNRKYPDKNYSESIGRLIGDF